MKTIYPAELPAACYSHRDLKTVGGIVLHYFSAINVAPDMKYDFGTNWNLFVELNMPEVRNGTLIKNLTGKRSYASAHVLMNRTGDCYQLVPFEKQAYHAGVSFWKGIKNCNGWTYGIELMGAKGEPFEEDQYIELAKLIKTMWEISGKSFPLDRTGIVGHDEIATPKGRKVDPGPLFDWDKLMGMINTTD